MAWRGTPCANWCHWGDDRCTRSDCFGCGRCVELAAIKQAKALVPALPQRASVAADTARLSPCASSHRIARDRAREEQQGALCKSSGANAAAARLTSPHRARRAVVQALAERARAVDAE